VAVRNRLSLLPFLSGSGVRFRVLAVAMTGVLASTILSASPAWAQPVQLRETTPTAEDTALAQAKVTGQPVEVAGRTSEMTKLSAMPDGQFELETAPVPVRVKRDGVFHEADLTLQHTNGGIASRMSVNGVTFGAGGNAVLATMVKDGKSLTLTWPSGSLPQPVLDDDSATYVDAGGADIDVVVRSTPTGWSHYVVVKTPEAAQNPSLRRLTFGVSASGVSLRVGADNGVTAMDAEGEEVFTASSPLMWEGGTPAPEATPARATPEEIAAGPAPQSDVKAMEVEVTADTLALIPDQSLLTAPDARFPIVIDPSWQTWNGTREPDGDGYGSRDSGWAYVDRTWPNSAYWKPDRLPTGREAEDNTDKRSYIRMNASPLHQASANGAVKVVVNSVDMTFDTIHAWSCTSRDVRLYNTTHIASGMTWAERPGAFIPEGSGWSSSFLAQAPVNVGRPECGDANSANDVRFTGGNLTRLMQWATDNKWDIFTLGLFPDADYNDTHTWKVMDVDPRMVVKFSRVPMPVKDVHLKNGGTTKYPCTSGEGRPWVGTSKDRTLHALVTDYDGDASGGYQGQPLRAQYELAPLGAPGGGWYQYSPSSGYQKSESDGYLHAAFTMLNADDSFGADGGTSWMWRVRGQDDTGLSGAWSSWCEFTIDGKRPAQPVVSSVEYPQNQTGGYDATARRYVPGTFTFTPAESGDVVKFHYRFADGTEDTKTVTPGASVTVSWTPKRFGPQWVEVTSLDRAGNPSAVNKYEFGVQQPPRDAAWAMDETSGNVAHAVGQSGAANPNADLKFDSGAMFGEQGNLTGPSDRAVRLNGSNQFGEVKPWTDLEGKTVTLVDTSQRFMFSTWLKPASTQGDQVAISQAAADGTVFELGWLGGRWTFRHRTADGTVLTSVTRDMAQAGDGTPWTQHWVSVMGGYDPLRHEIWLRTQAEGSSSVCDPDEPWICTTQQVMPAETKTASATWTPAAGAGSLLVGATATSAGKGAFWNGWIDDSQLWPLAHPDESVLFVIYRETVQDQQFAGANRRLVNVNSGRCLDVEESGTASGANVQQWTCNGTIAQDWVFNDVGDGYYRLTNPNSGKCLAVDATDGSGTADGRNVWQYDCDNASDGQKWFAEKKAGGYWLKSKLSGKCLAVPDGAIGPGANVAQWTCLDDPLVDGQLWNITARKWHEFHGATFRMQGAGSGKCLETAGGLTTDGANVIQWACNEAAWQDWKFTDQGNGYYSLTNVATLSTPQNAMCLEVAGSAPEAGANIQQGLCEPGAERQAWKVEGIADDGALGYRLIAQHSGMVAGVKDASAADGADVVQNTPQSPPQPHQVWRVRCLPNDTWRCQMTPA
jgi:hypothetical protein